jgi:membrane protein YqaA with SNARE-associated domain
MQNLDNDIEKKKDTPQKTSWKKRTLQIFLMVFVIALSVLIFIYRDYVALLGVYGYIGAFFIALVGSASLIMPVPSWVIIAALGAALNPWIIGTVAAVGGTIGELSGYGLGFGGRIGLEKIPHYERIVNWMRRWGGITIFVLALIPNPLFDIAGAAAGALKYPVWKFMLWGFLGRWPKSVFYAYVGIWFSTVLTWF